MEIPIRYDVDIKDFKGSVLAKARKFNRLGLIERVDDRTFLVKPIKGYNHTTYEVRWTDKGWVCNCQAYVKEGKQCSHILAVKIYLRKEVRF